VEAGAANARGGALAIAGAVGYAVDAGGGGESSVQLEPPSVDIAGRWGMFLFEDPVGVQLSIDAHGKLSGRGCAAGAPTNAPDQAASECGDLSGTMTGNRASFTLPFNGSLYVYAAETTVSADGKRMTGRFHDTADWRRYPTAWLRIADGQAWFPYPAPSEGLLESAQYDLRLVTADPGATEYVAGKVYSVLTMPDGLTGDLGSFWFTEMTRSGASDRIEVGPVSPTAPELAVSMTIELDARVPKRMTAITGSGHKYVFAVSLEPEP
jgi:hypothetical protein